MFPDRQYQNNLRVCLEILYRDSRNTVVQERVCVFVIISTSLFIKEKVSSKAIYFYEKYIQINCSETSEP